MAALDPHASGLGVAWAGEQTSRNWFDLAREYTEKWHHQQQLRDATEREPLYQPELLEPALETFARGLPFALRDVQLPDQGRICVQTTGAACCSWTLRRQGELWTLWRGLDSKATCHISLPADVAWRVWTRGMDRAAARQQLQARGDPAPVDALLSVVAIMA